MRSARPLFLATILALVWGSAVAQQGQQEEHLRLFEEGKAHYLLNDFPMAIRAWKAGSALKPDIEAFHANLAKCYSILGREREALAEYQKAVSRRTARENFANVWGDVGGCRRTLGQFLPAIEAHIMASDNEPDRPRHWYNLAIAYSDAGRPAEAVAAYTRCLELDPAAFPGIAGYRDGQRECLRAHGRPQPSTVAAVESARWRACWLDVQGAREELARGDSKDPAVVRELEEVEARAAYLDALGPALAKGPGAVVTEGNAPPKLRGGSSKGLDVEGQPALVPWTNVPFASAQTLVAGADALLPAPSLGGVLVLYDLALWPLADRRVKAWVDAEPAAATRAFELVARSRGLAAPPVGGFRWTGSEWLTPDEEEARAKDLVVVDGAKVTRAEATKLVEAQRRSRLTARRGEQDEARGRAERLRAERGVTDVRTLLYQGDPTRRADVVVVADGFTAAELPAFERIAEQVGKALTTVEPFLSYSRYVNVHRITVAAERSGIAGTRVGTKKIDGGGLSCDAELAGEYARLAPDCDLIVVCANVRDVRPSGKPGVDGGPGIITMDASGEFTQTVVHELGHSLADLDDEYVDPGLVATFPDFGATEERRHFNVTRESNPRRSKWHYWLLPPAPSGEETVGCFEGGYYRDKGYFRPSRTCRMNDAATRRYCAVCLERMELSFYARLEAIDDASPREPVVAVWKGDALKLSATTIAVSPAAEKLGGLTARWYVDDRPAPAGAVKSQGIKTELALKPLKLAPGAHEVVLRVDLKDARVRRDGGLLSSLRAWRLEVTDAPAPKLVAPAKVVATRGQPVIFEVGVEGGNDDLIPRLEGPPGSTSVLGANRTQRFVWYPPRWARGRFQVVSLLRQGDRGPIARQVTDILLLDSAHQVGPVLREQGIVEAERGRELTVQIDAFDPDGDGLVFIAKDLPAGAELEPKGLLTWTPAWSSSFDQETTVTVRVSDGAAEDEATLRLRVRSQPTDDSADGFDVLVATRTTSTEGRKAAFGALLRSNLPRGGKLLELVRLLRDPEEEVVTQALETLRKSLAVSEETTRGLVVRDLSEQAWAFVDRPAVRTFLAELCKQKLPDDLKAPIARLARDLAAMEAYDRELGR